MIVTEPVRPLWLVIDEIEHWSDTERNLVAWGCYQVAVRTQRHYCSHVSLAQQALAFLNDEVKVQHGNINIGSIFVTQGIYAVEGGGVCGSATDCGVLRQAATGKLAVSILCRPSMMATAYCCATRP